MLKDLNYLDNNAQIMPRQKENVSDYKTSIWRKQSSSTDQFIRANKCVKIRISNSKEVKIMTTLLIGKQGGNCTKSSRETCRILHLRRPHHGRIPHGKIGIHRGGIHQSLTKGSEWHFFSSMQFRIAGTQHRQFNGRCTQGVYTEYTRSVHHKHYSVVTSTNMKCVLVAQDVMSCSVFMRMQIVTHLVSHVILLLVSTSPSHFQSTATRSTTWTARPSPRRHCTPSTSSRVCTVDKQR